MDFEKDFSTADIILNVNNVGFDSLVNQKVIQTEEDKEKCIEQGYPFVFTETVVKDVLPGVDMANVWYTPSIGQSAVYFNKDTLAAYPLHLEFIMLGAQGNLRKAARATAQAEANVQRKKFFSSIKALPDAMSMEYFNLLLEKYPGGVEDIPDIFKLFFDRYVKVSFGFDRVRPETFRKIVEARTEADAEKVRGMLAKHPETLRVYRGGSTTVSRPPEQACSWTTSIAAALFFAGRLGQDSGYIATGKVPKDKVIYCQMETMEQEVIVNPEDVEIDETLHLAGIDEVEPYMKAVTPLYHEYVERLGEIDFEMDSDQHGRLHSARVLLMVLVIAQMLNLPTSDMRKLAAAAIYHDSMRDNDGEDQNHGKYSADYYQNEARWEDPVVSFIIEYHCRPDKEGYETIEKSTELSRNCNMVKKLFDIFKDADALDRVRFGWQDLDINQLRLPVSKTLPLIAMLSMNHLHPSW